MARLASCAAVAVATFIVLLFLMGRIAAPYSPQTGKLVPDGPFGEVAHILTYAEHQTSPHGPQGIASYPVGLAGRLSSRSPICRSTRRTRRTGSTR